MVTVAQTPATSVDLYGASVLTATRFSGDPRRGSIYDAATLAAGVPVHLHPLSPTRFLVTFSRRWHDATTETSGLYSDYTENTAPSWFITDTTGQRFSVGATPLIPIQTAADTVVLQAGCSRGADYLYLLHTLTRGGEVSALVQHFQVQSSGRVVPVAEEIVPGAPGVTFDKGLAFVTPNLVVYGTDAAGRVHMIRKPWRAIGQSSSFSARSGLTTDFSWQYGTGTGWSTDPADAAPEPGLTSVGPVSYAIWRNTLYLATVAADGDRRVAKIFAQLRGQPKWKDQQVTLALGSVTDDSYVGGTLQFQPMMGATPALVAGPDSETAFPFVVSSFWSGGALLVSWGLFQVPRSQMARGYVAPQVISPVGIESAEAVGTLGVAPVERALFGGAGALSATAVKTRDSASAGLSGAGTLAVVVVKHNIVQDSIGTTGLPNASYTGTTAYTFTHTLVNGICQVFLGISIKAGGANPWSYYAPTLVKFDTGGSNITMTLVGFRGNNNVTNATGFVALYTCAYASTSGAKIVSVTCPITGYWWAQSVAYLGVASLGSALYNSANSTNPTTGAMACTPGQRLIAILGAPNVAVSAPTYAPNTPGSSIFTQSATTNIESGYILDGAGGPTTEALGCSAASSLWAAVGVAMVPS